MLTTRQIPITAAPANGQRGVTASHLLTLVTVVGWLVAAVYSAEIADLSIRALSLLLLGSAVLFGSLIRLATRGGAHSLAFLLFLVLCLFHLGLYLHPALTGQMPPRLGSTVYETDWYNPIVLSRSGMVVLLGLLAYATSIALLTCLVPRFRAGGHEPEAGDQHYSRWRAVAISNMGTALLVVGVATWYGISIAALGPDFLLRDYLTYRSATSGYPLPLVYLMLSIGTVLAAVHLRRRIGPVALLAFGVFAIPAFLIGLRGEVLIPAVAAVPVILRDPRNADLRRAAERPAARLVTVAAAVLLLVGISLVQQIRLSGLQDLSRSADHQVSALAAVQEMGYSVRVVATSISWHEDFHQPYAGGETYLAPLERPAKRILGLPRLNAESDYGLMNVEIAARIGPIGGSMIGEAHHNFGIPGVAAIMGLTGAITVVADRPQINARRNAWLGVVGLLTLMHVRNSFAPLFAWAIASFVAIAVALALARFYQSRRGA